MHSRDAAGICEIKMKHAVAIELIHHGQTDRLQVTAQGEYYEVAPLGYLRYIEHDEQNGETATTIRLLPDELRIQRRGAVESQLTLKPAERTAIQYRMGGLNLQLIAYTKRLEFHWTGCEGNIVCHYELWQHDERLDSIRLTLNVSLI
jgi:uncharacterized beta-barrel protein YwiB (DUF1934 family)